MDLRIRRVSCVIQMSLFLMTGTFTSQGCYLTGIREMGYKGKLGDLKYERSRVPSLLMEGLYGEHKKDATSLQDEDKIVADGQQRNGNFSPETIGTEFGQQPA